MRCNKTVPGLLVVAAAAFTAGRLNLFAIPTTAGAQSRDAAPQDAMPQNPAPPDAEVEAFLRAGTPGINHAHLEPAIGEFDAIVRFRMAPDAPWMESTGIVRRQWVLGNRFVRETIEGDSPMGAFSALAYIGYNNIDGQYEFVWMESLSTAMMFHTGTFDAERGIMSSHSTHRDPVTGRVVNGRGEWNMSDPDRHTMTGYIVGPDGKEFKSFEGVFKRRPSE